MANRSDEARESGRRPPFQALVVGFVLAASTYANLPEIADDPGLRAYVPPFRAGVSLNMIDHLGGEYLHIARAIVAGQGFASPFGGRTGPTAWMPPVYPALLAGLLATIGDVRSVAVVVVTLQNLALIATGWIVLGLARRTVPGGRGEAIGFAIFVVLALGHFRSLFQFTHDSWLVMLGLGAQLVGATRWWGRPIGIGRAIAWGLFGGASALTSPVLGLTWLALSASLVVGRRAMAGPIVMAGAVAAGVVAPWVARNLEAMGRFIPVKSNLYFELHQANVQEPDGVIQASTFRSHPYRPDGAERAAYAEQGEIAYLDGYRARFLTYLRDDPRDYLGKVARRAAAATVVYHRFDDDEEGPTLLGNRLAHALPAFGLAALLLFGARRPRPEVGLTLVVYIAYLIPYVLVSYYERYGLPLLAAQALFGLWGWEAVRSRVAASIGLGAIAPDAPRESPSPPSSPSATPLTLREARPL